MPTEKTVSSAHRRSTRKRIRPAALTAEDYVRSFETFRKTTNQREVMLRWIKKTLLNRLPSKDRLSVLSIGSGNGNFDLPLIEIPREKFNLIRYAALEPNKAQCEHFKATTAASPVPNVRFTFRATPFETFRTRRRFDLIHLTHCLYYMPNREQVLLQVYKLLAKRGRIIIFHQTPLGINQIQRKFLKQVKGNEKEMFSSRELEALLTRRNLSFELESLESSLDITEHSGFDTGASMDLLSFFLECNACQIPRRKKERIVDFIRSISHFIQGRRLLFHPVAVFSITKE